MEHQFRSPLSRLKTSLERRTTPIIDKVITPSLSSALVKTPSSPVVVLVHIDEHPADPDWDQCINFLVRIVNDLNCNRCLVWIPGSKTPNREQSKRVVEIMKQRTNSETFRTSILNPNSNITTKLVADSFLFLQRKAGLANGLNIKFFASEEEAIHHVLIDPDSKTAKDIHTTIEYLFDKTMKMAKKKKTHTSP